MKQEEYIPCGSLNFPAKRCGRGRRRIPEEKVKRMLELYPTTKTAVVAEEIGCCKAVVERYARQYGIKKDPEYMHMTHVRVARSMRANQIEYQKEHPRNWTTLFKKGHSVRENMSPERQAEYNKRISESRKETIRKERMRINFGLPQKTNMRLVKESEKKRSFRRRLRNKGYLVNEEKRIAYFDENTIRSPKMEAREQNWYRFEFKGLEVKS